jgi:hypothetical protein
LKEYDWCKIIQSPKQQTSMSQDYSKIDTSGTKITTNEDGTFDVTFDKKKVTERAFKEVMEYIYTDRVGYAKLKIN